MARAGKTLGVAESFTGGRVLDALTDVPGASRVLRGGLTAYADDAKTAQLRVPEGLLRIHGAVSRPVAQAMARGARDLLRADYALATTGIAGPDGGTPTKPVGLSFCAAVGPRIEACTQAVHAGARAQVKEAALAQALQVLREVLRLEGIL